MNQGSQMVSRDLQNIGDLFSTESLVYQKTKSYIPQIQDANTKQVLQEIINHRKQSFEKLQQYLMSQN